MKGLDFLVIGAPKCGTTSLFHYLRNHPRLYIPAQKELPFFSEDDLQSDGWDHFAAPYYSAVSSEKLWGKLTPEYMKHPVAVPERIRATMPEVKLIAVLRNPIDRARSAHRMAVKRKWSWQSSRNFEELASQQMTAGLDLAQRPLNTICVGLYAAILRSFLKFFPPSQLLVLFTEEMEADPEAAVDSVLVFLGLPAGFRPANLGKKYHVGGTKQRFPAVQKVFRTITPLKWLWRQLPKGRRRALKFWWWTEVNVVKEKAPDLPAELREKMKDFYRPDVQELEQIIQRKVPWPEFG